MKSVAERGDDDALRERAQPLQQQPDERAGGPLGRDGGDSPPHQAPGHLALRHQEEERGGRENDCTLRPEPLQQQPDVRAGGLRVVNGVSTTGPNDGGVGRVYPLPGHRALLHQRCQLHRHGVRQKYDVFPPAVPDGGPQEAQRARGVRGQHRGEVPVPLPRDGGREGVLPGHQEPLFQAAARAQCGVMRAAATHTTPSRPSQTGHEASGKQQFCSVENRVHAAVSRGQSQGQLAVQEEDLKRRIPMKTSRSGLGSSVIKIQGSGQVDQVGYGDQCLVLNSYGVVKVFKLCLIKQV